MQGNRRRSVLRRRKAGLTDYRRRLRLLRSQQPRAVVRVSNTRTSCQLVTWAAEGDKVALNVTGNDLVKKFSWPDNMSKKSVPASYLVGYALERLLLLDMKMQFSISDLQQAHLVAVFSLHFAEWSSWTQCSTQRRNSSC